MRINKFVALASGLSRRAADQAVAEHRVKVNGQPAATGQDITETDNITLDNRPLKALQIQTIMLNKPTGYVVSRDGQGNKTIYDLLPEDYGHLKPIGRLDKDSSGLLLLTNDGNLANQLTHPSHQKAKIYEVKLTKPLTSQHFQIITGEGVLLEDGPSKFALKEISPGDGKHWRITMHEGRNRQIRRTLAGLGYGVNTLHRTHFGAYVLPPDMASGQFQNLN
ncbi:MAG TPA: pseudouridine synthase [Patescibacteria group bacterium]|nr:pseudouridine synthase [Patescibacteria group bacterium]